MFAKSSKALIALIAAIIALSLAGAVVLLGRWGSSSAFLLFLMGCFLAFSAYALHDVVFSRGWRIFNRGGWIAVAAIIALSIISGFLLEAGTVAGSISAPTLLSGGWRKGRLALFAFLAFCVISIALWYRVGAPRSGVVAEFTGLIRANSTRSKTGCIVVLVLAVAVTVVAALCGAPPRTTAIFFLSLAVAFDAIVLFRKSFEAHLEYPLIIVLLCLGANLVIVPPAETGLSFDDQIHYDNAVALSYVTDVGMTAAEEQLRFPPGETTTAVSRLEFASLALRFSEQELDEYDRTLDEVAASSEVLLTGESYSSINYKSLGYIPTSIGLWITRLLHLPLSVQVEIGKLFNFLFYAWCCFMAVRVTPARKLLVSAIVLLPGSVFLAASFTYDSWLTGLTCFALALVIRALCDRENLLSKREIVTIFLLFALALGPKPIYFPVLGVLLLMPQRKFATKAQYRCYIVAACILALVILASFAAPFLVSSGADSTDIRGGSDVDSPAQLQYVLGDLPGTVSMLSNFIFTEYLAKSAPEAMVKYAYLGNFGVWKYAFCALLIILAFMARKDEPGFIRPGGRIWVLFIVACTNYLVALALYITFTPVGLDTVNGVQGRYLFPLLMPLLAFCCPPLVKLDKRSDAVQLTAFSLLTLLSFACVYALLIARIV